jgi:hypothetical protein
MRILRYLLVIATVAALCNVAKADTFVPGDFAAIVIDPLPLASEINIVLNPTFPITLTPCQTDQLDGLSPTDFVGCFTGLNNTGTALTSLTMQFPAILLAGDVLDTANCPIEAQNIFTTISCGFTDSTKSEYVLDFSGGDIPSFGFGSDCRAGQGITDACEEDSLFTIAIGGIPFNDLPQNFTADANTIAPEPDSIWLMSTGVLSIGLFAAFRRRMVVCEPRL